MDSVNSGAWRQKVLGPAVYLHLIKAAKKSILETEKVGEKTSSTILPT